MKRVAVAAACSLAALMALWLPLLAYVHCDGVKEWKAVAATWISGEETRRLMRYHGAAVLKITQDRVYIWRESRWIPVHKRNQS